MMPIENIQEFTSVGAWNISCCAQFACRLSKWPKWPDQATTGRIRGPFLESPVNLTGPKSNIQIEVERIRTRVLASKLVHFVSLTDSFVVLGAKLLKPRSLM